jgi:hypothetical protein
MMSLKGVILTCDISGKSGIDWFAVPKLLPRMQVIKTTLKQPIHL